MPIFELQSGRLVPARFGHPVTEPLGPEVLDAVQDQVLEIVQRPLFPVSWHGSSRRLTAMDVSGQAVTVEVLDRLDAASLVDALSHAGWTGELGWIELAGRYARGVASFRRDWNAFREAQPVRPTSGPSLIVVTGAVEPEVRHAVAALGAATLVVHELALRQTSDGRRFLESQEVGGSPTVVTDRVLTGRVQPDLPGGDVTRTTERGEEPRALGDLARALAAETTVIWQQLRRGVQYEATLTRRGTLRLPDAAELDDPTEAARVVSGRAAVDGWQVWRLGPGGPSLAEAWEGLGHTAVRATPRTGVGQDRVVGAGRST